jgi:hypothetical protein
LLCVENGAACNKQSATQQNASETQVHIMPTRNWKVAPTIFVVGALKAERLGNKKGQEVIPPALELN